MRKMTTKGFCMLGVSMLALGASPALAQSVDTEDDNVIIVSANKRETNLQETPIAITAVTAREIELRGIAETKDLSAVAPNVVVSGGSTNATAVLVTIRGIPMPGDETLGFDSSIGIYLDGVYLARASAASFEVADLERVEVLRGPQGTLFGRNTTGGAISYVTRRPTDDFNLKAKFGYANYNQKQARLLLNTGDLGGVRISAGYVFRKRDGTVDNLLEPRDSKDPGGIETHGLRYAIEADLADNLTFYNVSDWTQTKGTPAAYQLAAVGDGVFRPNVTVNGNQFAQVQPANVRAYLASATVLEPGCPSPLASISLKRLDALCNQGDGVSTDKVYGNMTKLEWTGDAVSIRSTTAFRWARTVIDGTDLDGIGTLRGPAFSTASLFNGMPAGLIGFVLPPEQAAFAPLIAATPVPTTTQSLFQASNKRRQKQFSQELEIIGGTGTSFEWVVGAFYFKESGRELNPQSIGFVLDTNTAVFTDASFGPLGAGFRAANPARYRMVSSPAGLGYTGSGNSTAIYAQGTYRPGGPDGSLGITLGMRYTWDEKTFTRFRNGATDFTNPREIAINDSSAKFSQPTGHITIDYKASPDFNFYAKAARGYRSGGFNARQTTTLDNPATPAVNEELGLLPFNEEKIDSFEVGAKMTFGPARLNLAAFHNIYKDQQVSVPIPIVGGGGFGTQVVNAGKTNYTGIEAEAFVEVTDNLTIDGSFGYIDIKLKQFPTPDINGVIRNISSIVGPGAAPDTTASAGVAYVTPIGSGDATVTGRVGWTYTSEQFLFPNPLTAPFRDETSPGARSLFNAQLRFDKLKIGNGPDFSVQLWGKNITDKEYISRSVDFSALGLATNIYGDPATYGIDVEFSF
jgi:iron complex outermembrane receptor protein